MYVAGACLTSGSTLEVCTCESVLNRNSDPMVHARLVGTSSLLSCLLLVCWLPQVLLSCVAASVNMLIGVLAASLTTGILTAMIFLLHILLFTSIYVNFSTSHAHTPMKTRPRETHNHHSSSDRFLRSPRTQLISPLPYPTDDSPLPCHTLRGGGAETMELPWLGGLRYLSYLQYGYEALVSNEMAGRTLTELPVSTVTERGTCGGGCTGQGAQYAHEVLMVIPLYHMDWHTSYPHQPWSLFSWCHACLDAPSLSSIVPSWLMLSPAPCGRQVESGSAVLAQLGFRPERLDMDITMLLGTAHTHTSTRLLLLVSLPTRRQ